MLYLVPVAINGADPVGFAWLGKGGRRGRRAAAGDRVRVHEKAGTLKTADFVGSKVYHLSDGPGCCRATSSKSAS